MPKNTPPAIRRGRPRGGDEAGGALTGDSTVAAEPPGKSWPGSK